MSLKHDCCIWDIVSIAVTDSGVVRQAVLGSDDDDDDDNDVLIVCRNW